MKIYTKTGDNGTTSILGGTQVSKADIRVEVYGTIDELNAQIGVVIEHCTDENDRNFLSKIQDELFQVGLVFATDWDKYDASSHVISKDEIIALEKEIDKTSATLPSLKEFIMPRGSVVSAFTHVARTVCRRTERLAVALVENSSLEYRPERDQINELYMARTYKKKIDPEPFFHRNIQYLNRLSDYLFVLARKNSDKIS
ncbi:MAG: cob(I)yrinic acid a,c-diamide adenosyltransferase [Bacteroidales bacterium]|jgi:cob(I)alamin adenosyltransferase|nr:cob(I)yrinic acid a,c-diamide adenosyltransferase [Bacteroidales bacterium]